jgi:hypothetical protein
MYYGQRNVRMYDPGDIKKISWDVGSHGADVGKEMTKASNTLDEQDARAQQEHDMGMQQQRRAYDSQTARDAQQRKFSVLDGLRGAMFRG